MYSKDSLKKFQNMARELLADIQNKPAADLAVRISKGNKKIGRVMNVSLLPIFTCANCKGCRAFCYDIKACLQYPANVLMARVINTVMAKQHMSLFFEQIDKAMSRRRKNKFFRWHVAGDIISPAYFANMVKLAWKHADFIIWTYTKNYKVVNDYVNAFGKAAIPSNFKIMFSEWDGMKLDNPYNFPIFTCKLKAGNKNHPAEYFNGLYKCPGNCDICKKNGKGCTGGMDTYADEH